MTKTRVVILTKILSVSSVNITIVVNYDRSVIIRLANYIHRSRRFAYITINITCWLNQTYLLAWLNQTCQTGGQLFSDTFPYEVSE